MQKKHTSGLSLFTLVPLFTTKNLRVLWAFKTFLIYPLASWAEKNQENVAYLFGPPSSKRSLCWVVSPLNLTAPLIISPNWLFLLSPLWHPSEKFAKLTDFAVSPNWLAKYSPNWPTPKILQVGLVRLPCFPFLRSLSLCSLHSGERNQRNFSPLSQEKWRKQK